MAQFPLRDMFGRMSPEEETYHRLSQDAQDVRKQITEIVNSATECVRNGGEISPGINTLIEELRKKYDDINTQINELIKNNQQAYNYFQEMNFRLQQQQFENWFRSQQLTIQMQQSPLKNGTKTIKTVSGCAEIIKSSLQVTSHDANRIELDKKGD